MLICSLEPAPKCGDALIIDAGALAGEEGDMATECVCNLGCVTSTEKSLQSHTSII